MEYNFTAIETKWRERWKATELYKVNNYSTKPKYYILDMFPYPSGAGLHVGHPLGYIATDIIARYKNMKGYNVLHPMGFDAFGLPAEQYAIETGVHPSDSTNKNIERYRQQLDLLGFNYDWSREVMTCDPDYYRWTQQIFIWFFEHWYDTRTQTARPISELEEQFNRNGSYGVHANCAPHEPFSAIRWRKMPKSTKEQMLMHYRLAYLSHADVWYCPALGCVLANDEVKDGLSERGGHPVERRKMTQWFLRITAYADRLLRDLDSIDWPDSMKETQRNWIGRSEGASLWFPIADSDQKFEIFTTRIDTIFGVTFMVLAPEHDLVAQITTPEQKEAIDTYVSWVKSRSEIERQAAKTVSGCFTGAYAINPFNNTKIPIYISEYVLAGYGTGAIMAVPADDDRDYAFAQHFKLPVIDIINKSNYPGATKKDKLGVLFNSAFLNGLPVPEAIKVALEYAEDNELGERKINYKLRDMGFGRQRYWGEPIPIIYKRSKSNYVTIPVPVKSKSLPIVLPDVKNYKPRSDGKSPLANLEAWNENGFPLETDTMPGSAGSSWYFLRYMDTTCETDFCSPSALQYWENVDFYLGGAEHGTGHLLYARFWHKFLYDLDKVNTLEPFKKLVNQGMIQGRSSFVYRIKNTNTFVSHSLKNQYDTTELYVDIRFVENDILDIEGFKAWREDYHNAEFIFEADGTYKCGWAIEKMSKSKHNAVTPDDVVAKYGADCLRLYEMFLGPIEDSKPWSTDNIAGTARFLRKFWMLFAIDEQGQPHLSNEQPTAAEWKVLHRTIKAVTDDIERFSLNTCVSHFMKCVNDLSDLKSHNRIILSTLVRVMSPFAPFITEELWERLGNNTSVYQADFPVFEAQYMVEDTINYPIQINGKLRGTIDLPADFDAEQAQNAALENEAVKKNIDGKTLKKFVFVKGKIINIVV
ncbi:MAG: leucine--tRNA ligase [Chitinophagales bacterium]|nr:leucine--tRNA ligase [Chitinophagales bacterium]